MIVQVSKAAIKAGPSMIERELAQLKILNNMNTEVAYSLSSEHHSDLIALAQARGLRIAAISSEESIDIAVLWGDRLRVSLIIACYNYGHFLDEAVESVLAQSYLPDEIILSDDASTDDSAEIMKKYSARYPERMILNLNENNLGIQRHFNQVVNRTSGDLIIILGADNRIPSNYVESLLSLMSTDERIGVAYTDFALFGGRAKLDYERMIEQFRGARLPSGVFITNFPDYDEHSKVLLSQGNNFIHGSSMYRKSAFDLVNGYENRNDGPEDLSFFQAILSSGLTAKKARDTFLEYRQHSADQANYQFSYFGELKRLRLEIQEMAALQLECDRLQDELSQVHAGLTELRNSRSFKIGRLLLAPARVFLKKNPS
jgi:glycosyltransferase involved in cell wall biosynthesis